MMKVQNHMESFQVLAVEPNLEALMSDLAVIGRIRPKPLARRWSNALPVRHCLRGDDQVLKALKESAT